MILQLCALTCCLLWLQDHARAFAGSQSDESKYKLYMKAMGFDAIIEKQKASEQQLHQVRDYLNDWKERLEVGLLSLSLLTVRNSCCTGHTADRGMATLSLQPMLNREHVCAVAGQPSAVGMMC